MIRTECGVVGSDSRDAGIAVKKRSVCAVVEQEMRT
jgi:hypothetical protein